MNVSLSFKILILLGIIALAMYIWHKFWSHFKTPKTECVSFINGAIKSGKTTLAVFIAKVEYKRVRIAWRISCIINNFLHRTLPEEPLLYSNVPLGLPYVPLTKDLLLRKKRFRFHSVIYVNEASLLFDNGINASKEPEKAEALRLWCKLIGHELHGGKLIFDTQALGDVSIEIRRNLSNYFYIHHTIKLPFFIIAYVREERYSEDGAVVNAYTEDLEESLKRVLIPKRIWKYFDAYAFSYWTDSLECEDKVVNIPGALGHKDLKVKTMVSFVDFKTLKLNQEEMHDVLEVHRRWSAVFNKGTDDSSGVCLQESSNLQGQERCGDSDGSSCETMEGEE